MIYFTQDTQTRAIKIGYSKNPKKRIASLQTATPNQLLPLGAIHGGLDNEAALHCKFAAYRLHGEWFRGDILPAVLEIIAKNPTDKPPPSNVIVTGDSHFRNPELVPWALDRLHADNPIAWVITGGDRCFDSAAEAWAQRREVDVYRYLPKWGRHGRYAGFKASQQMLRSMFDPKLLLAFLSERPSTSTCNLIRKARKAKMQVVEVMVESPAQFTPILPEAAPTVVGGVPRAPSPVMAGEDDVPWTRPRPASAEGTNDDDDLPPGFGKRRR